MLEINKRYRQAYNANFAAKGLIDRHAAAALLGITVRTLQRWHHAGRGPKRVSGPGWPSVWYRLSEVEQWRATEMQIAANSGHQTAEKLDVQIAANSGHQTAEKDRMTASSNSY
jgi:predicted DNA-binding transcriptional regulator AlpA